MIKAFLADAPPIQKLLMSLFVIMVVFFIFMIVGLAISIPLFNINIFELQDNLGNPSQENVNFLKFFQLFQSIGAFVIPPFIIAYILSNKALEYLRLKTKPSENSIFFVILLIFISLPLINFIYELNNTFLEKILDETSKITELEQKAKEITELLLSADTIFGLLFNLFLVAVIPALGEELLFRGVIQRIFIDMTRNKHIGILIAAILFSGFHMQFFGFLPRFALGMVFGYLLVWSGSLWLPILAHFANNAMAVVAYYFIDKGNIPEDIDKIGSQPDTQMYALFALPFFVALLYGIYQTEQKKQDKTMKHP